MFVFTITDVFFRIIVYNYIFTQSRLEFQFHLPFESDFNLPIYSQKS